MRFNCITGLAVERDGSVLVCDHQPQRAVYHSPTFRNIWNMPRMPTAVSGPNRQPAIVCASSVFRDPDRENSVQAEIMRVPITPENDWFLLGTSPYQDLFNIVDSTWFVSCRMMPTLIMTTLNPGGSKLLGFF